MHLPICKGSAETKPHSSKKRQKIPSEYTCSQLFFCVSVQSNKITASLSSSLPLLSSLPIVVAVLARCHCHSCRFFSCRFWLIVIFEPRHRYSRRCLRRRSCNRRHCYHPPPLMPLLLPAAITAETLAAIAAMDSFCGTVIILIPRQVWYFILQFI